MTAAILAGAAVLFAVGLAIGLRDWRWSIVGLLVYLPVSRIPIDAAYGHRFERAVAVLAKDLLFVVPAYVGFAVWAWRRRERVLFPGAPVTLIAALAAVVLAQAFNPAVPRWLLAVIGIKVWLFYVPLLFLGYHLVRTRTELYRLLGLIGVAALVPAVIGLIEAALIYSGHKAAVYRVYGHAAAAVTQEYTGFELPGGGTLKRIPSTFSSFYQYYLFLAASLAVAYAWWRGRRRIRSMSMVIAGVWLVVLAASFFTGVRAAFFMTPFLLALIVLLEGRASARFVVWWLAPLVVAIVLFAAVPGSPVAGAWGESAHAARVEFGDVVVDSSREAASLTVIGLGTGIDSIAGRYAFRNDSAWEAAIFAKLGRWHESWWVKTWLELGVIGFAIVLALFATIVVRGVRARRRLHDRGLATASAALLAVLVWSMVYAVKGQYLDLDPLNVFFWLFAGLLFKLPLLEEAPRPPQLDPTVEPVRALAPVEGAREPG